MAVNLKAGANTIEFSNPDAWAPNLDHIAIWPLGAVTPGFNIAYPAQGVTIASPGQFGIASINLIPAGGFSGNVTFACVLPTSMTGAGCSSPAAYLSGTAGIVAPVTVTSTAPASAALRPLPTQSHHGRDFVAGLLPIQGVALAGLALCCTGGRRKKLFALLPLWILSVVALQFIACGGAGSGSVAGSCVAVPGVPGGLTAASMTPSGAQLSWEAAVAGSNCAVTGYTVYENGRSIATAAGTSYVVSGLSASTTYSFTVAAADSFGGSPQSAPLSVTTASATGATPPGTYPVQVIATSGGLTQTASFNVIVQ
jgi:hypothetical protein